MYSKIHAVLNKTQVIQLDKHIKVKQYMNKYVKYSDKIQDFLQLAERQQWVGSRPSGMKSRLNHLPD